MITITVSPQEVSLDPKVKDHSPNHEQGHWCRLCLDWMREWHLWDLVGWGGFMCLAISVFLKGCQVDPDAQECPPLPLSCLTSNFSSSLVSIVITTVMIMIMIMIIVPHLTILLCCDLELVYFSDYCIWLSSSCLDPWWASLYLTWESCCLTCASFLIMDLTWHTEDGHCFLNTILLCHSSCTTSELKDLPGCSNDSFSTLYILQSRAQYLGKKARLLQHSQQISGVKLLATFASDVQSLHVWNLSTTSAKAFTPLPSMQDRKLTAGLEDEEEWSFWAQDSLCTNVVRQFEAYC